jgi:hypothetical protein
MLGRGKKHSGDTTRWRTGHGGGWRHGRGGACRGGEGARRRVRDGSRVAERSRWRGIGRGGRGHMRTRSLTRYLMWVRDMACDAGSVGTKAASGRELVSGRPGASHVIVKFKARTRIISGGSVWVFTPELS